MNIVLWFVLCLLASIGAVQIIGWLKCGGMSFRRRFPGYYVAALPAYPDELESCLRRCLEIRSWGGIQGPLILLSQQELEGEEKLICDRMLEGAAGVFVCYPGELEPTITCFQRISREYESWT